jgi:hypothetical protein
VAVTTTGTLNDFPNLFPPPGAPITTKLPDNLSVNLPAAPVGNAAAAGAIALLFTNAVTGALHLELSALEADGKGKIVSSPRVMTANNVEALIEQGTELPYQQATSSGATSVSFRKANLALKVTPQITPDGNIIMKLDINKDSVGQSTNAGFAIDTKHVQTQVLVENGGTVVIGGTTLWTVGDRHQSPSRDHPSSVSCSEAARSATTRPSCWCSSRRASSSSGPAYAESAGEHRQGAGASPAPFVFRSAADGLLQ